MTRATPLNAALLVACSVFFVHRAARAETPNTNASPIYVLSIWTDDADDQADALTQALRSRVRQSQAWSLLETVHSFETLAIALKCPPKPDASCLQRIGDQLHADRYLWGTIARKRSSGTVSAELHYWRRARPGADITQTFSDNLKDPNDESVRAVAASALAALTGAGAATFVVHAGEAGGAVLVDGVEAAKLEAGTARVDVSAGAHVVRVRVPGFESPSRTANASPGAEQNLTFSLTAPRAIERAEGAPSPFPVRQVVAYSAVVAGTAFLVGSAVEAAVWLDARNKSHDDRLNVPTNVNDVCVDQVNPSAVDACRRGRDALNASTLGWIFAGVGATLLGGGVFLLVNHRPSADDEPILPEATPKVSIEVTPLLATRGGSVHIAVIF